jgi:hypothetical protein
MKMVKVGELIHVVTYSCGNRTLCNTLIPKGTDTMEKKSVWEATCAKCKQIASPIQISSNTFKRRCK